MELNEHRIMDDDDIIEEALRKFSESESGSIYIYIPPDDCDEKTPPPPPMTTSFSFMRGLWTVESGSPSLKTKKQTMNAATTPVITTTMLPFSQSAREESFGS